MSHLLKFMTVIGSESMDLELDKKIKSRLNANPKISTPNQKQILKKNEKKII